MIRMANNQDYDDAVLPDRCHSVIERRGSEAAAMSSTQRWWKRMKKLAPDPLADDSSESAGGHVQYTLKGSARTDASFWSQVKNCNGFFGRNDRKKNRSASMGANQKLAASLHWAFRVNFLFLFVVMCVTFFVLVILFAGFIASAGFLDEECVRVGAHEFNSAGTGFADAFALSWTTLSTVGYGSTYPSLSHENDSPTNCFYINFICSLESLLGVLYSGFCGAILFGKVLRIQSHAQVVFSDPILLRYGSGVTKVEDGSDSHSATSHSGNDAPKHPCPVLEFRVVNRLFGAPGGEIIDATLNVVANVNANDSDPSLPTARDGGSTGHLTNRSVSESAHDHGSPNRPSYSSSMGSVRSFFRKSRAVHEDPSVRLVQHKHLFSKLLIEAPEHPFFKRCWVATHMLDENSPILKPRVCRIIRKNGGSWPEKLNNPTSIRESLQFNQILVSLNGVSNISASDVYAQKIYDFVDLNIGYNFVNILYRDSNGALGVDIDLINDVREQDGGGGEPLMDEGIE